MTTIPMKIYDAQRRRHYYVEAATEDDGKSAVRNDQWREALDPSTVTEGDRLTCEVLVAGIPDINTAVGVAVDDERRDAVSMLEQLASDMLGGYSSELQLSAFKHGMDTMVRALRARLT